MTSKDPKQKYRVQCSWGGGSYSWRYFDTIKEADLYAPPSRYDFMGYAKKPKRLTVQQWRDGKWRSPETDQVRIQIRGGRPLVII